MSIRKRYLFLAVGFFSLLMVFYQCHKDYYQEYNIVTSHLKDLQDVEMLNIDGNRDLRWKIFMLQSGLRPGTRY
jgi:hypothetical protein